MGADPIEWVWGVAEEGGRKEEALLALAPLPLLLLLLLSDMMSEKVWWAVCRECR